MAGVVVAPPRLSEFGRARAVGRKGGVKTQPYPAMHHLRGLAAAVWWFGEVLFQQDSTREQKLPGRRNFLQMR